MSWLTLPVQGTTAAPTPVRSLSADFRLECAWCGWGDHNTDWHEAEVKRQKPSA